MAGVWKWTKWSDDEDCWNADDEELAPGIKQLARAVAVWAAGQMHGDREVTVGEAATVFNVEPARVAEAIKETRAHFTYLDGDPNADVSTLKIDFDGE